MIEDNVDYDKVQVVLNEMFKYYTRVCDEHFGVIVKRNEFFDNQMAILTTFVFYNLKSLTQLYNGQLPIQTLVDTIHQTLNDAVLTDSVMPDKSKQN